MMIFSITKPKRKLKGAAIGFCLLLLLGVGVPSAYQYLRAEDAMSGFAGDNDEVIYVTDRLDSDTEEIAVAEIGEENVTGDPIKVNATEERDLQRKADDSRTEENSVGENKSQTTEQLNVNNDAEQGMFQNFWQKILAVIFGSKGEVLYYSD